MPNFLTYEDEQNFGRDLLDVSQRAALTAVAPHIQNLEQQNAALQRRLAKEARHRLDQQVEAMVPDFREIDAMPAWHRYLLGLDAFTGRVRQTLLNDAVASGSASRVKAFFDGFRREAGSTRAPASTRTASRRFSDKPVYTRDQIAKLYDQHRRGAYVGREAEWEQLESDFIAAGREGRVLNPVDLHGK